MSYLDALITCLPIILILYGEKHKNQSKLLISLNFIILTFIIIFWNNFNKASALFSIFILIIGFLIYRNLCTNRYTKVR